MYLEIPKMPILLISVRLCVSYRNIKEINGFYMKCKTGMKWVNVTDVLLFALVSLSKIHTWF